MTETSAKTAALERRDPTPFRAIRRVTLAVLAGLLALVAVVLVRALAAGSMQVDAPPIEAPLEPAPGAHERLAEAVRLETVSDHDPAKIDPAPFIALRELLERSYPGVHETMTRETISDLSYLYVWEGSDPKLAPILLMGHQDVVPVEEATLSAWTHPPFSGVIADGAIWGRGTLDDKYAVLGLMEAAEALIGTGFVPGRTIYFAFGHDEEVGGKNGAVKIVELLKSRGVEFEFVLDEGLAVVQGIVPGTSAPVALVGIAEKGFLTLNLEVAGTGGHSSMPPPRTAVGVLARAVARLEDNQVPATLSGPSRAMFEHLGPEMDFAYKVLFTNLWLFGPIVQGILEGKNSTNATLRTTTAVTMFEGSPQDNVLPQKARAAVNFRVHPRDTIDDIVAHVEQHKGDERVQILERRDGFGSEASPVSSTESRAYRLIATSARQVWPESIVGPGLTVGATDSRYFAPVADDVYRFSPLLLRQETNDTSRIHGTDERILTEDYDRVIDFYIQLMRNASKE